MPEADHGRIRSVDFSPKTIEEVTELSENVIELCRENGIEEKQAFFTGLCLEELAVNAIQHNAKLKHPLHLHVRFAITEKQLVLRLRDQGRPYDLTRAYSMIKPDDPSSHIGLHLVYASAEEVTWSSFFQMNNICIRLAAKRKDDNSTETAFAKE